MIPSFINLFLHFNLLGSHGDENGKTIVNSIDLLKCCGGNIAARDRYLKESVNFIKRDLEALKLKKRVSVFLINSHSVPIYPGDTI